MVDFSGFHLSEGAVIRTKEIPGKRSRELLKKQSEIEGNIVSYPRGFPIAIARAKGVNIEDVDGNMFLDFFSCAGVVNLGHCNEEILAYTTKQQQDLVHALDFPTQNKLDAIQKVLENLPASFRDKYVMNFVGPTGSDAIEAAIKLARIKTGREAIIAFSGSYHGMTSASLSATSNVAFRNNLHSLAPNIHYVPYSYCYRCVFNRRPDSCHLDCLNYLKTVLEDSHSGIPKPAAILIEPVQGEGGNIPARGEFLEKLVELAHKHDVLVIFDEIQSGFFRSGDFLSFMNTSAMPDIITISKGLGGVGFPIAAIVYKKEIDVWGPGKHVGTFRGNQVSVAAANGAFDFMNRYDVVGHVRDIAVLLNEGLTRIQNEYPNIIGEIRGKGLMIGVEIVKNADTREPFPEFTDKLRIEAFQRGLIFEVGGHYKNVVRILPPLIITPKIVHAALDILGQAMRAAAEYFELDIEKQRAQVQTV